MRRVVRSLFAALAPAAATADAAPAGEPREEEGSAESARDGPANAKQNDANGFSTTDTGSADADAPAAAASLDAFDDDIEGDALLTPPRSPPPVPPAAALTAARLAQAAAGPAAPPPTPALSEGRTTRYALRPRPSPRLGKNDNNAMPPAHQLLLPHAVLERLGGQEIRTADKNDDTSAQQHHQGRIEQNEQAAADAAVSSAFFAAEAAADNASSAAVEAEAAAAAAPVDSASVSVSAADALDMRVKDVEEASVRSLRAICAELGLPRDGPKNALRARALAALEMDASEHQFRDGSETAAARNGGEQRSRFRRPQKTFAGEVVQDTAAKVAPRAAEAAARRTSVRRSGRSSAPAGAPASLSTDTARLAGSIDRPEPLMDKGDEDEENNKNKKTEDQGEDERSDWTASASVADSAIENSGMPPKRKARKPPARLSAASISQRAALPKRNRSSRTNTTVNSGALEPLSDRPTQGHDNDTAHSPGLNDPTADGKDHKDHKATKHKQPEQRRSPILGAATVPIACHEHIADDRASQADLGAPLLVPGSKFALPTHLAAGLTESVDAEYAHVTPAEDVKVVQDDTPIEGDREGLGKIGLREGGRAARLHPANLIAESPGHVSGAVLSRSTANGPPSAAETDAAATLQAPSIMATPPKRGQEQAAATQAVLSGSDCQRHVSTERLSLARDKDVLQNNCIPATPAPSISVMYPSLPGDAPVPPEESIDVHAVTNAEQQPLVETLPVSAPVVDVPTLSQVSGGVCLVKGMAHNVVGISDMASAVVGEVRDNGGECTPPENSPARRALLSETVNKAPWSTADTVLKGNIEVAAGRGRAAVEIEQYSRRPHPPPPPTPSDPTVAGILNEQVLGTRFQNDVVTSLKNTIRKRPHSFMDVAPTSGGSGPRGVPGDGGSPCRSRDLDPRVLECDVINAPCGFDKYGNQVGDTDAASERKQLGDYGAHRSPGAMPPPGKRMRLLSSGMDPSLAQVGSGPGHVVETSDSAFEYTVKTVPSNNGGSTPPCERLIRVPTSLEEIAEPNGGRQGISIVDRTKGVENCHPPTFSKGMSVFSAGLNSTESNFPNDALTAGDPESRPGRPRVARLPRYGPPGDTDPLDVTGSRRGMASTSLFQGHPQPILLSADASVDNFAKTDLQNRNPDLANEADNTLPVLDEELPGVVTPSKEGSTSRALLRDQTNPTQDTLNGDGKRSNHPILRPEPFRQKSTGFVTPDDIIRTLQNRASRSASHSFPIPRCSGSRGKSGFSDFDDIDQPFPGSAFQPPSTRRTGSKIRQIAAALSSPSPYRGLGRSARRSSIANQKDEVAALPRPSGLVSFQKRGANSASGGLVTDLRPADTRRIGYTPGERIAVNTHETRFIGRDENGELNRHMLPAAFGGDQSAAMSSSARRILETLDRVTKENRVRVVKRNRSPLGLPSRGKRQRVADVGGMDGGLAIGGTEWFVNTIERHAAEAAAHANANDLGPVSDAPGPKKRLVSYMSGDEGDAMNADVPRSSSKERLPASLGDRLAKNSKGASSFVPYPKAEGIAKKRRHTEKKFASKAFAAAAMADYGSVIHDEHVRTKTVGAEDATSSGAEQTCQSCDFPERLPSFSFKQPPPSTTGKPSLPLFSFGEGTRKEGDQCAPSTKSPIFGSSQVDTLPETQASHYVTDSVKSDREATVSAGSYKIAQERVDAEHHVGDDAATSADVNRNGARPHFGVSTNADDALKIVQDSSVAGPTMPQPMGGETVSAFGTTLGTNVTPVPETRHADISGFHFNVPRENVAPPISSFEDHPGSRQAAPFPGLGAAPERTSVRPSTTATFAESINRTWDKPEKSGSGNYESATQSAYDAVDSKPERVDDRAVVEGNQTSFSFTAKDGDHVIGAENVASSKLDCPEPSSLSAPSPDFSEPKSVLHASVPIVDRNSDKADGEMAKSFANEDAVNHQSGPGADSELPHLKDLDEAAPSIDVIPQIDTGGTASVFSRLKGTSQPERPAPSDGSSNLLQFATSGSGNLLFGEANQDTGKPAPAPESQRAPTASPASGRNDDRHGSEADSKIAPATFSFGAITKEATPAAAGSGSNSMFGQVATNPFSGNPLFSEVPAFGAQVAPAATGNPFSSPAGVFSGLLPPPPSSEQPALSGVPAFGAQVPPAATSNPFSSPAGVFPGSLPPPPSAEQPAPSKLFTFGAVTAPAQPVSNIQVGLGQSTPAATGAPFSTLASTQNTPFGASIGGIPGAVFGETFAHGQASSTSGLFGTSASVVLPSLGAFGAASHTLPAPSAFGSASAVPSPSIFGSPPTLPSPAPFGTTPGGNLGMPSTPFGSLPQSTPALQFGQPTDPPAFGVSAPSAFGMPSAPAGSEAEQPGFSMGSSAAPTRRRVLRGKRSIR
jgi:hypothetical protein